MTDPTRAFNTEHGRFYRHIASKLQGYEDPKHPHAPRPSITNVMKMLDEGFLPGYHAKLVAEYAVTEAGVWQQVLKDHGEQAAIDMLKSVPDIPHPNGAIGDNVHAWIDAFHAGRERPELDTPTAKKMIVQYIGFLEKFSPRVLETEYTVWSYEHCYAGTGDAIWGLAGDLWAIDFKSGTRVYPKTAMQLAAAMKAEAYFTRSGEEKPLPPLKRAGILHVRPMSCRLYEVGHVDEAWLAFLGCKALFDWTRFWKEDSIPMKPSFEVKESVKGVK